MSPRRRRPLRALALAAAISALAAPAATAAPVEQLVPGASQASHDRGAAVRVVEVQAEPDFDWGDAGIGATAMLGLAAIGAGTAVATRYRVRRLNPS